MNMSTQSTRVGDPFADPISTSNHQHSQSTLIPESTLAVSRNASLTLGTDALVVLGMFLLCTAGHVANRVQTRVYVADVRSHAADFCQDPRRPDRYPSPTSYGRV